MNTPNGVLVMVAGSTMRDDVDRVAAAAGVSVVHLTQPPSRQSWGAASAVLVDVEAARRCATPALPRRGHVVLLSDVRPRDAEWEAAIAVGAQRVLTLPADEQDLVAELSEAAHARRRDGRRGAVVAVMAGCGGAGASLFATALARTAQDGLLVDVDPWSGGIDLALGSESEPGLRWPDLLVEHGRVDVTALRAALPVHAGLSVLSSVRAGNDIDAGPLAAVIEAGRRGGMTVVCDLPRRLMRAVEFAADTADLVVLVTTADVRGCAATTAVAAAMTAINPNVGLVVRGPSPGGLRARDVARIVELPLLSSMRPQHGVATALERGGLPLGHRSPLAAAARRVLKVLAQHPTVEAA
jgi:secretion/DNA translocation related CpaE-like protein